MCYFGMCVSENGQLQGAVCVYAATLRFFFSISASAYADLVELYDVSTGKCVALCVSVCDVRVFEIVRVYA